MRAQQIDFAVGAGTLLSAKYTSSSQGYLPATEKGGNYPSVSADVLLKKHFGLSGEFAFRARQGLYNGYQGFRPVLYDVNALYAPRLGEKTTADLMAGIGGERAIFYNRFATCGSTYVSTYVSGCTVYISSNHFLGHIGAGVRYYFWHNFFVRPEAHLYFIHHNFEFNSNYVGRLGVSLGYTFSPQ
jgi:hypothetical protein